MPSSTDPKLRCLVDELTTHSSDEIKDVLMNLGYLDYEDVGPCILVVWQDERGEHSGRGPSPAGGDSQ